MTWEVFSIIGTIAFAISGAIVAMEEEYDIFGVYILGIVTAFGGGALRNTLIGLPVTALWEQTTMFQIALVSITLVFIFPHKSLAHWNKWGNYFDAIGLSAFAIQGALFAVNLGLPIFAAIAAAILTGAGGGVIRDLLAGRKPLVLQQEVYAVWAGIAGTIIGFQWIQSDWALYVLFAVITGLRIISYLYKWSLPFKSLKPTIINK